VADIDPTEMFDIKVTRQDGVRSPASGFPILVMKSAAASGTTPAGDAPVAPEPTTKDATDASTDLPDVRTSADPVQGAPEAPEGVTKTSGAQAPAEGDDDVASKIEKAVAEATRASEERMKALESEVAKMRATPIPGGPMLTATAVQRDVRATSDLMAKAAYHKRQADIVGERELARYHREQAAAADAALKA